MKKKVKIIILLLLVAIVGWFLVRGIINYKRNVFEREQKQLIEQQITDLIHERKLNNINEDEDPFGDDNLIKILLIGIDSRAGDTSGHCDAIQLLEIHREQKYINITALPRGTYVPLPGSGYKPGDYYVSNSCGLVSIEYGIEQMEKILGKKADYVAMVGFSEALGIFRDLKLPTTQTLQWLRNRHGFAIGEPQRAHNHSTFIKQMLIKYLGDQENKINTAWQYLIYKAINTDLSFQQTQTIVSAIEQMDLQNNSGRIKTFVKPHPFEKITINADTIPSEQTDEENNEEQKEPEQKLVKIYDIEYDEENLSDQLDKLTIQDPNRLTEGDYSGLSAKEVQGILLNNILDNLGTPDYDKWAFENNVWLQLDDEKTREEIHYKILTSYINLFADLQLKQAIISDYIIEMETREEPTWLAKGKQLLADSLK